MLHRLLKNCIMENDLKLAGEPELELKLKLSLTRPMHLIQQLKLWKALDFSGESFFNCCKRLMHFFKAWSTDKL